MQAQGVREEKRWGGTIADGQCHRGVKEAHARSQPPTHTYTYILFIYDIYYLEN
jgi:hypothetical protein